MITDNTNGNGVPNGNAFKTQGINQRTQLVKPTQVNNTGRVGANIGATIGSANAAQPTQRFNPIVPGVSATNAQAPTAQTTPSTSGASVELSDAAIARSAISRMNDEDIVEMLNEIASGSLKGAGPRAATATTESIPSMSAQKTGISKPYEATSWPASSNTANYYVDGNPGIQLRKNIK